MGGDSFALQKTSHRYLKYFFIQFIKVLGKFGTFFKILEPGEAKHSNFYEFGQDMPNGMVVLLNTS